ncbi:carbohydrate ABC transporter permease [Anoxybacillus rupiensis]|jgi:multiple sugar transport system permease protein|uniref:Carbohydrate ABC transporter permease n=1 Tax=Anoxybacteroides rupiense TaxID=311460 RepID=A0ABD5IV96_9BACL|nr:MULTISPECIES: carbohydrate ABC transporter permease [Anoxybacillus]KXG10085.1 Trehalose transport system permease protein SugB [Anoxybacillus sp. P3H1B]MBB3907584.1 multiple sugar transport system permease protein [Anoxybacillus rupiensis]MBS2771751.1 carbohydrate ABC transporter permease [Anoxybacillus rupiensis]MDE8564156.1 carbohydrate ABC transporter permease [Anoxybacillus rupiensis]MED5051793.1 carbohydrate ABC transporter permease [Anoxybacillus rupiensis]
MSKKAGPLFYVCLAVFIFFVMFPFLWILLSSVKPLSELFGDHAFQWFTSHPTFESYVSVFVNYPFLRYLWNSTVVATITTVYTVFVAAFAAYAIARLEFKGKAVILGLVLAVSMFPQIATISPIYMFVKKFGLTNSYLGLIIPYTTFALPLSIWLLVTFFRKIPFDLEEAAKMDGATPMQTYFKVILPLAVPGVFTTSILVFIAAWNEFLFALTINTAEKYKTVPVGIAMFQGQYTIPWGELSAATVIVTVPLVIMVLLFQRRIVSGLTSGSVKE